MNKKIIPTDIILPVLALLFTLGSIFIFHACGAKEDGSFMSCHWAERVIFGLGCVMTIISVIHFAAKRPEIKTGLSIALIPIEIFTALVPGFFVNLCMMSEMRCHTIMRPADIAICAVMIIATAADIFMLRKKNSEK